MAKLEVECAAFKPVLKNTLRGFASLRIPAMRLTIHDVTVHQKNASRWVGLPQKAQLDRTGNTLKDQNGKVKYATILEFANADVREAFSKAALLAIEEFNPDAFSAASTQEEWQ